MVALDDRFIACACFLNQNNLNLFYFISYTYIFLSFTCLCLCSQIDNMNSADYSLKDYYDLQANGRDYKLNRKYVFWKRIKIFCFVDKPSLFRI